MMRMMMRVEMMMRRMKMKSDMGKRPTASLIESAGKSNINFNRSRRRYFFCGARILFSFI